MAEAGVLEPTRLSQKFELLISGRHLLLNVSFKEELTCRRKRGTAGTRRGKTFGEGVFQAERTQAGSKELGQSVSSLEKNSGWLTWHGRVVLKSQKNPDDQF